MVMMRFLPLVIPALFLTVLPLQTFAQSDTTSPPPWLFEPASGVPNKLFWATEPG